MEDRLQYFEEVRGGSEVESANVDYPIRKHKCKQKRVIVP